MQLNYLGIFFMSKQSVDQFLRTLKEGYGFIYGTFRENEIRTASKVYLRKRIGHESTKRGQILWSILKVANPSYDSNSGKCLGYVIREHKRKEVRDVIMEQDGIPKLGDNRSTYTKQQGDAFDYEIIREFWLRERKHELETGNFSYNFQSHRHWNSLQNIKTTYRERLFLECGYSHNYDIDACAPTVLSQLAKKLKPGLSLPTLDAYLEHKDIVRETLSQHLGLEKKAIKVAINALVAGAKLGAYNTFSLHDVLGSDYRKTTSFKNNAFIQDLRKDLKNMWDVLGHPKYGVISRHHSLTPNKTGKFPLVKLTSKEKWNLYFQLENSVMTAARDYLESEGIKYFLEHDGFRSDKPVDISALEEHVYCLTGFNITFKGE